MRSKKRKIHFRVIDHSGKSIRQFWNPCGTNVHWTKDTTKLEELVTCKRCLDYIDKHKK